MQAQARHRPVRRLAVDDDVVGFDVQLFERATEVRAAGNILNLWPPPQKVLKLIGVDTDDLGAPCHVYFHNAKGRLRADVRLPDKIVAEYGGGFIGLLRSGLYSRMLDAVPPGVLRLGRDVAHIDDHGDGVRLTFTDGALQEADVVVGADGINSFVRGQLWGEEPIRRQFLHLVGGYLFLDEAPEGIGILSHNRTTQVSYTPIRHQGRWGHEWWVLEAFRPGDPLPADRAEFCRVRVAGFPRRVQDLIAATPVEHLQRWEIRDRPPLKQWSKGRVTLVGDAAHPTSPYAAYGAGMSIEDRYFLARELDAARIGMLISLASIGVVIGAVLFQWISNRLASEYQLLVFLGLRGLGLVGIGFSAGERVMTAFAFVQQLGAGILIPALALWTMAQLRPEHRGRGMGIWSGCFFLGQFVSPLIVSAAQSASGSVRGAFIILGMVSIAGALSTRLMTRTI